MNIHIERELGCKLGIDSESSQSSITAFLKTIITSQLMGVSYLPYQIGLEEKAYQGLIQDLNDEALVALDNKWHSDPCELVVERSKTLTDLFSLRTDERDDLINLLLENRNISVQFSDLAAIVVATACLSAGHLWKTLGFTERSDLSKWMSLNFPVLSSENTNMRWKRFLYLQLCKQGGDYICRAPSCGECSSFNECFLPK